jgi:ClpP class serine protease
MGVKYYFIASDSTKVMGNSATPMQNWEMQYWQWSINSAHNEFMRHVWSYRATQLINTYEFRNSVEVITAQDSMLVAEQFRLIANGMLYSAKYALRAGLIDDIMYFDDFITALHLNRYIIYTADGKVISDFYPFSSKESLKEKMKQEVWDHLQVQLPK